MNDLNYYDQQQISASDSSVNLIEVVYKLFDKAILILLAAALGAALMGFASRTFSLANYTSTSKLYLINTDEEGLSVPSLQAMSYLVYDYVELFQTDELHQRVIEKTELNYTAKQLSKMVKAEIVEETHIISITATSKTPEEAELLANAYADAAGTLAEEKFGVPKPRLFAGATPATRTLFSSEISTYILGAMGGLILSCVAVVLCAAFDDRIYTPEDVQRAVGVGSLGVVTKQKRRKVKKGGVNEQSTNR